MSEKRKKGGFNPPYIYKDSILFLYSERKNL